MGEKVALLRAKYSEGTKVRLLYMNDPQAPPVGAEGTIVFIDDMGQIHVAWENGGSLALIPEAGDRFEVLPERSLT